MESVMERTAPKGGAFGRKLRLLRATKGWSQQRTAKEAGLRVDTLSLLERGKSQPRMPTLFKLAEAFGVSVEELLEASEAEE